VIKDSDRYDFQIGESAKVNYSGWLNNNPTSSYYLIDMVPRPGAKEEDHNFIPKGTVVKLVKQSGSVCQIDIPTYDYTPVLIWHEGISPLSPLEKLAECCE